MLFPLLPPWGRRGPPDSDDYTLSEDAPLPQDLVRFLSTGSGVRWLSSTVKAWPALLDNAAGAVGDTLQDTHANIRRVPLHLNSFLVREYRKLVRSEVGKRLINGAQSAEAAVADPLSVPLFVVEDFVRLKLQQLLSRSWRGWVWRLCTRASAACAVLHLAKLAAKRAARGRPRAAAAVAFACDVLLPTGFYGPAAGITLVVVQQVRALRGEEREE